MGNFLKSLDKGGPQFLATQTLLQTGNTFAETRLYNPLGTLIHTIPFVHTPRNIGKLPQIIQPIREYRGGLQSETLKKFSATGPTNSVSRFISGVTNAATSPFQALSSSPTVNRSGFYPRPEDDKPVGLRIRQLLTNRGLPKNVGSPSEFERTLDGEIQKYTEQTSAGYAEEYTPRKRKLFKALETDSTRYLDTDFKYNFTTGSTWDTNVQIARNDSGLSSNIRDLYNIKDYVATEDAEIQALRSGSLVYGQISGVKDKDTDIIPFIFSSVDTANPEPIHFRAFISSLKQSVKPEFNETRYVGRTERFVTYAGAKRTATLQFNIVAFSESELDAMWLRINYLTGLAFPKGVSTSGFMIPPLFKLTVGGIYENQPCYIESLDFDLLDESITFDIDKHVSQVINVNMSITLLEKRSSFYNSPFYGIAQNILSNTLAEANALANLNQRVGTSATIPFISRPPQFRPQINIPAPKPLPSEQQRREFANRSIVEKQRSDFELRNELDRVVESTAGVSLEDICKDVKDPELYRQFGC
jgi:hypothetical protein